MRASFFFLYLRSPRVRSTPLTRSGPPFELCKVKLFFHDFLLFFLIFDVV